MRSIGAVLSENTYPGRGIVVGQTADGCHGVTAYFIMGRSVNSRNRVFVAEGEGLRTQAHDPALLTDPSLVIYAPVRVLDGQMILTNGDQTDTIWTFLKRGETFEAALRTRTFEPDAPNYTPRISGLLARNGGGFDYTLSILKSCGGDPSSVQRFYYQYPQPIAGQGHFIHTYLQDDDPLPSFAGEPRAVEISDDVAAFGEAVWDSLDDDNKVSLFVRCIAPDGGEQTWIYNKMQKKGAGR